MKAYLVSSNGEYTIAPTQAIAKSAKHTFVAKGAKKDEVSITQLDIPVPKPAFIEWLNDLIASLLSGEEPGSPVQSAPWEDDDEPKTSKTAAKPKRLGRRRRG
jgi:hypothetical protein